MKRITYNIVSFQGWVKKRVKKNLQNILVVLMLGIELYSIPYTLYPIYTLHAYSANRAYVLLCNIYIELYFTVGEYTSK